MPAFLAALPDYVSALCVAVLLVALTGLYAYERYRRRDLESSRAAAESARKVLGLELERTSKSVLNAEQDQGRLRARILRGVAERLRSPVEDITRRMRSSKRRSFNGAADFEEFASLVNAEMAKLEGLVESLLDLAALEAGSVEWKDRVVDAEAIVGRAVTQANALALRHEVRIEAEARGPIPAIYGDPDRLAQVLGNLIDNAIKFSSPGAVVATSVSAEGSEVIFSVTDTGEGMADDQLERLLDNLDQVGVALDGSKAAGTLGIGLSVCRLIVRRHGGRFWSETREGDGSEFGFALESNQGPTECPPK